MKMWYISALLLLLTTWASAQAPLLLPTRSLAEELRSGAGLGWRQMFLVGGSYQPVEESWLKDEFLPKFKKVLSRLRFKTQTEGFDCDNFAELFRSEMGIENHLAGRSSLGQVACGVVVVQQRHSFGRILASSGEHALVVVRTENGWCVIEPQTLKVASLDRYPNRGSIEQVYF